MPTYLIHGFRWPRPLIRIHIILNNLEDAAAEWLMAADTTRCLKEDLSAQHPSIMSHLSDLRFVEQYDPSDESHDAKSQPYAYVADMVHEVRLGIDIDEVRGKGVSPDAWGAMVELRDKLAPGEKVAWFVVVCGDTERSFPSSGEQEGDASAASQLDASGLTMQDSRSNSTITSRNEAGSPTNEKKRSRFTNIFRSKSSREKTIQYQKSSKALPDSPSQTASTSDTSSAPSLPSASSIDKYAAHNHHQNPPHTASPTSPLAQQLTRRRQSGSLAPAAPAAVPPRAGILPSPPVSALPSPLYPPSSGPDAAAAAPDAVAGSSAPSAVQTQVQTQTQTQAQPSRDLPLRHYGST